jgi:hypothetical protein
LKNPGTEADSAGGNPTTTATIAAHSIAVDTAPSTAPVAAARSSGVVAVLSTSVMKTPARSKTRSSQKGKSQNVALTALSQ